jgi:hypothetical protein
VVENDAVTDALVVPDVCFCCKTSVTPTTDNGVVALWRHIFPDSVRDIAATVLGRKPGSPPTVTRVGADNWKIAACPDDGPASVVSASNVVHAVWPTAVSSRAKGIFFSSSTGDLNFAARQRVDGGDAAGTAHPQIALVDANTVAVVWDEALGDESRVVLRRYNLRTSTWQDAEPLTNSADGIYPVAAGVDGDLLVAWTNRARLPSRITLVRIPRD